MCSSDLTGLYERLWERNIPVVFINGYYPQLPRAVYVVTDDQGGGRMAAAYLARAGFKRIGGIFKSDDMQGHLRYQGFSAEMQERGLPVRDENVCWFSTESKRRFLRDETGAEFIRGLKGNMDAVVCYNDEIALELMAVMEEHHLSVPGDISIVSFDNSAYAAVCHPKLTTLAHPKDEFGRVAAEKLLNMISGKKESSAVLPWTMIERDSVLKR